MLPEDKGLNLSKITEFLGIAAIVSSLLYVGYEIRHNSLLAQASTNIELEVRKNKPHFLKIGQV